MRRILSPLAAIVVPELTPLQAAELAGAHERTAGSEVIASFSPVAA